MLKHFLNFILLSKCFLLSCSFHGHVSVISYTWILTSIDDLLHLMLPLLDYCLVDHPIQKSKKHVMYTVMSTLPVSSESHRPNDRHPRASLILRLSISFQAVSLIGWILRGRFRALGEGSISGNSGEMNHYHFNVSLLFEL